jgi:uncharacterized membrane protein
MVEARDTSTSRSFSPWIGSAGYALGFALGGFFDGILLHQILQWHHLLSGLEQAKLDIRALILWDGVFHAFMYVIAVAGLYCLWQARRDFAAPGADRRLLANAALGFGGWHLVDAVLSHWILGLHRIRMDVEYPLVWDLLWLCVFGIVPLAIGLIVRRSKSLSANAPNTAPIGLILAVFLAGPLAALPPSDGGQAMVIFGPSITEQEAVAAISAVEGTIISSDPSGTIWMIGVPAESNLAPLYLHGAWMVSGQFMAIGCFDWTRAG